MFFNEVLHGWGGRFQAIQPRLLEDGLERIEA